MKRAIFISAFMLFFGMTQAQWVNDPSANTLVASGSNDYGEIYVSTCESTGDTYFQWSNMKSNGWVPSIQKVDRDGNKQWGDDGILVNTHQSSTYSNGIALAATSDGCVVSHFVDERTGSGEPYAVKLNPDGTFAWGEDGIQTFTINSSGTRCEAVAGLDGSVWVAANDDLNTYVRHISADGTLGPIVTISDSNGKSVDFAILVVDAYDNVSVVYEKEAPAYTYYYEKEIFVAKYTPEGAQATPETMLMSLQTIGGYISHDAVADGLGGGYAWISYPSLNDCFETFIFHFDENGNNTYPDNNGIKICEPDGVNFHSYPSGTVDPITHDLIVAFHQTDAVTQGTHALRVNRITTTGEKPWGNDGFTLIPTQDTEIGDIKANAFPNGNGAVITYIKSSDYSNNILKAIGINGEGNVIWETDMSSVASTKSGCEPVDGFHNGTLILAWSDGRNSQTALYAQNIMPDGTIGPLPSQTNEDDDQTVSIRQNDMTLNISGDVIRTVTLFSVAGRNVMTVNANDAENVSINIGKLSAGIYIVQVLTDKACVNRKISINK